MDLGCFGANFGADFINNLMQLWIIFRKYAQKILKFSLSRWPSGLVSDL